MKHLSDEELLIKMDEAYDNAKNAPKDGYSNGKRGAGSAGRIAMEWVRYRSEALKRGLVK